MSCLDINVLGTPSENKGRKICVSVKIRGRGCGRIKCKKNIIADASLIVRETFSKHYKNCIISRWSILGYYTKQKVILNCCYFFLHRDRKIISKRDTMNRIP